MTATQVGLYSDTAVLGDPCCVQEADSDGGGVLRLVFPQAGGVLTVAVWLAEWQPCLMTLVWSPPA